MSRKFNKGDKVAFKKTSLLVIEGSHLEEDKTVSYLVGRTGSSRVFWATEKELDLVEAVKPPASKSLKSSTLIQTTGLPRIQYLTMPGTAAAPVLFRYLLHVGGWSKWEEQEYFSTVSKLVDWLMLHPNKYEFLEGGFVDA